MGVFGYFSLKKRYFRTHPEDGSRWTKFSRRPQEMALSSSPGRGEIKGKVVWVKGGKGNPHLLQAQKALDYLLGGRGTRFTVSTAKGQ